MERRICIHGHFYQPPRENPWLEEIERQDSAWPYRDWNERITAECYAPNAASRILDEHGCIREIVNNYSRISFNFGPTLLSWMDRCRPETYRAVIAADEEGRRRFSGHGPAIAQAYNHMILPLADAWDKRTQVLWGLRDFELRFGRPAEGMWLPETAVDTPTLEVLAEAGVRFTILAPSQALRVRRGGAGSWEDTASVGLDPRRPYRCPLPSGRSIAVFFYDGPISHDIAFGGLLNNGETLVRRLKTAFASEGSGAQIVSVATDGETYGHHHRFGNMALSYALHLLEQDEEVRLTVFGEYLERHPPEDEVSLVEPSSWSCSHGVERWRSDCGCRVAARAGWTQRWRVGLRAAMDGLRDRIRPLYVSAMERAGLDPRRLRDDYIDVVLDPEGPRRARFLTKYGLADRPADEVATVLSWLEVQRQTMLMHTSCGWFFDDISGLEAVQIMQYAARAVQLVRRLTGEDLEPELLAQLRTAEGNLPEYPDGAVVYERKVRPAVVDLLHVGAHYAISALFDGYASEGRIYCYEVGVSGSRVRESGRQSLFSGRARVRSRVTGETREMDFCAFYFGDYNISAGVRPHDGDEALVRMQDTVEEAFLDNDVPGLIQRMNEQFGPRHYTLWDLFRNEQSRVFERIFAKTLSSIETHFREIYEHYYPLMRVRPDHRVPLPKALKVTVEFILNRDLVEVLEADEIDVARLGRLVEEIRHWNFGREKEMIRMIAGRAVERLLERIVRAPGDEGPVRTACDVLDRLQALELNMDLWRAQNLYFGLARRAQKDPSLLRTSAEAFAELGHRLEVC